MVKYYVFGVLVVLVLMLIVLVILLKVLFGWIVFFFIVVSSVYLFNYLSLFCKCEDGLILFYICWIFVFFLLGFWFYNEYVCRMDKVFFL